MNVKQRSILGLLAVLLALVGFIGWMFQSRQAVQLRGELEAIRAEAGELERLRAENQRLRVRQVSAAELAALRADHAALPRLRAELEALTTRAPGAGP